LVKKTVFKKSESRVEQVESKGKKGSGPAEWEEKKVSKRSERRSYRKRTGDNNECTAQLV